MGLDNTARRRIIGALFLLVALAMLLAGETVLKNHLRDFWFLAYWLLCFLCTALAILVAYLDARALQHRTRREARDLLETTLGQIEKDAHKNPPRPPASDGN